MMTDGKPYIISRRIFQNLAFSKQNGGLEMLADHLMTGEAMSINTADNSIILIASVIILLIFPAILYWGWRKGQFRDIEEAKYRMIEMEEENGS
ncbi:MAG: hypothetical protein C3F06_05985 [Candidatus Methanoperedenaceae archaeon]|nr:MAG: hypothetical protein C3F06_05985 [Candidatus Methanoperedenaceae archaeon]